MNEMLVLYFQTFVDLLYYSLFICHSSSGFNACVCNEPSKYEIGDVPLPKLPIKVGVFERAGITVS